MSKIIECYYVAGYYKNIMSCLNKNCKQDKFITTVVLCGGSGTRLWPLSRELMPKQFIKFFDDTSLFQKTIARNSSFSQETIIISNKDHYYLIKDQLAEQSDLSSIYIY